MIYQTEHMLLQETQELLRGEVNDVIICRDLSVDVATYYTLLIIKQSEMVKRFLRIYEAAGENARKDIITTFTWENQYIVVYTYEEERSIDRFFSSDIQKLTDCEQLCLRVAVECMSCGIPYPILYLQLAQSQLNMRHDKSVHLGYCIDLTELDETVDEKKCALTCARILFDLLEQVGGIKTSTYKLLRMKNEHGEYKRFVELYRDLEAAAVPLEKENLVERGKGVLQKYLDVLFRILLVLCIIAVICTIIMLITQAIFGDLPFMRIFFNTFKQIGTESLVQ